MNQIIFDNISINVILVILILVILILVVVILVIAIATLVIVILRLPGALLGFLAAAVFMLAVLPILLKAKEDQVMMIMMM